MLEGAETAGLNFSGSESDEKWLADFKNQVLFELYVAYLEARRGGKRGTFDEHKFEIQEMENLVNLRDSLLNRTYRPSRGTAHIIYNPVIREIFAASFQDRVIHHWIYDIIYDWWDRRFIMDSYSCRERKGTKFGIERLAHHIQAVSENYKYKVYVVKLDIQGYFMSLPRRRLYERVVWGLDQQFKGNYGAKYELVKFCLAQTIFDDPCRDVRRKGWPKDWKYLPPTKSLFTQPEGVGMVIGNLTSQLLSNIYLDQLDRFVTLDLGWKHYGRYVDDFYFVVREEDLERAKLDILKIEKYLKELGLVLHPRKRVIQLADRGVPFLGAVVYPRRIIPGRRVWRNAEAAFLEVVAGARDPESVVSYLGHMKYFKSAVAIEEAFSKAGWEYML